MSRRLPVSTTATLPGWDITAHVGAVFGHVVIGTGLFTDLFSSFTDFFGTHSRSYQKKLDRINEDVLALLMQNAARMGGQAIIGLRMDHDEISGMGKSMLMVTASGTAVKARRVGARASEPDAAQEGSIAADDLDTMLQREAIIAQARAGELRWSNEETWRFIVDNQMSELAPAACRQLGAFFAVPQLPGTIEGVKAKYREFFMAIPAEASKQALHACIEGSTLLWEYAHELICERRLFDARLALEYLRSGDRLVRRRSLQLATAYQPTYGRADVQALGELVDGIRGAFTEAPLVEEKGRFGTKQVWQCDCGVKVGAADERCGSCGADRRGFVPGAFTPEHAIERLERQIRLIEARLRERRTEDTEALRVESIAVRT